MQWIAQVARRPRHARRSATVAMHMRATGRDAAQYRSRFSSYVGGGVLCSSASDGRAGTWRSNALADSSLCSVAAAPSAAKRRSLALADCVLCSVAATVSHMGFACDIASKSFSAMRNWCVLVLSANSYIVCHGLNLPSGNPEMQDIGSQSRQV